VSAVPRKNSAETGLQGKLWELLIRLKGADYVACRQLGQMWEIYLEIVFFMLAMQD